jgi:hypothetical protein
VYLLVFYTYIKETHSSRRKIPSKNLVRQRCAEGFNWGVKGLKEMLSIVSSSHFIQLTLLQNTLFNVFRGSDMLWVTRAHGRGMLQLSHKIMQLNMRDFWLWKQSCSTLKKFWTWSWKQYDYLAIRSVISYLPCNRAHIKKTWIFKIKYFSCG